MINNKQAAAYAKPHTMSGKAVTVEANPGVLPDLSMLKNTRVVGGNISSSEQPSTKTSGIVTRGNGAATKGITARGPMA